jgi:hypothetical protein
LEAETDRSTRFDKYKEQLEERGLCLETQNAASPKQCHEPQKPINILPWFVLANFKQQIYKELKTYFHQQNPSNSVSSTNHSPLNALILDLSSKMASGLEIPYDSGQDFINLFSNDMTGRTPESITIELAEQNKKRIDTANLKQNSTQMCGLGKGSVDEPKIQCVPSI